MNVRLAILLSLVGCVSQGRVAEDMREGLARASEALGAVLIAVEPPSYAVDPLASLEDRLRHPSGGLCPSNERDALDPDIYLFAELDYGSGCVPRSGLLATIVSGSTWLQHDRGAVEVEYEGLVIALRNGLSGDFAGTVRDEGDGKRLDGDGTLQVTGTEHTLEVALSVGALLTPTGIRFDAELDFGAHQVELTDVVLPYAAIRGECPTPGSGAATVFGGTQEIRVDFGEPGDSLVTVRRGRRTSDPTRWCGYATWLYRG